MRQTAKNDSVLNHASHDLERYRLMECRLSYRVMALVVSVCLAFWSVFFCALPRAQAFVWVAPYYGLEVEQLMMMEGYSLSNAGTDATAAQQIWDAFTSSDAYNNLVAYEQGLLGVERVQAEAAITTLLDKWNQAGSINLDEAYQYHIPQALAEYGNELYHADTGTITYTALTSFFPNVTFTSLPATGVSLQSTAPTLSAINKYDFNNWILYKENSSGNTLMTSKNFNITHDSPITVTDTSVSYSTNSACCMYYTSNGTYTGSTGDMGLGNTYSKLIINTAYAGTYTAYVMFRYYDTVTKKYTIYYYDLLNKSLTNESGAVLDPDGTLGGAAGLLGGVIDQLFNPQLFGDDAVVGANDVINSRGSAVLGADVINAGLTAGTLDAVLDAANAKVGEGELSDTISTSDTLTDVATGTAITVGTLVIDVAKPWENWDFKDKNNYVTKFPFSIPWDIAYLVNLLAAEPVAPQFDFPLWGYDSDGIYTIEYHVDLTQYDNAATALRTIFLIGLALFLAVKTRDIIRG